MHADIYVVKVTVCRRGVLVFRKMTVDGKGDRYCTVFHGDNISRIISKKAEIFRGF